MGYQTKLTKEQLAYNIVYHLKNEQNKSQDRVIIDILSQYEFFLKNNSKIFDKKISG